MSGPRDTILAGDALRILRTLPDNHVDCLITSPPYFRLRDYGVDGQLGLEASVDQWVGDLRSVLREARRVLAPNGTVWLNLGDSFSTHLREGAPRKSLLLGPERLALALVEDGWLVRNKIVWAKTNTIPSSVRDRLSTRHEVIYLLSRSARYFFDLDAIRLPHTSRRPKPRRPPVRTDTSRPGWLGPNSDGDAGLAAMHRAGITGHPLGKNPGDVWTLGVSNFRGAHFATYPEALIERMVRAGCPQQRCSRCHAPWIHPLKRSGQVAHRLKARPSCQCAAASEPGIVLDPFIGAGTTAIAAERLGRSWLGIELNPDFIVMAEARIQAARVGRAAMS